MFSISVIAPLSLVTVCTDRWNLSTDTIQLRLVFTSYGSTSVSPGTVNHSVFCLYRTYKKLSFKNYAPLTVIDLVNRLITNIAVKDPEKQHLVYCAHA